MSEAWRLLMSDLHQSPGLTLFVLLPPLVALLPLLMRVKWAGVPFSLLVVQAGVWYGWYLMGGWSDVTDHPLAVRLAVLGPTAISLVVAVVTFAAAVRRIHAHQGATRQSVQA
jgi:hypothetical protein